jgi:hypothetical protein
MLFLITGRPKSERELPLKVEFLDLVVKEWEAVISLKKEPFNGPIKEVYGFRDGTGGIIICEMESKEAVGKMLQTLPLFDLADWDIKEMLSAEEGLATAQRKYLQAIHH